MILLDAITQVLTEADEPLHVADITERILGQGLWQTKGKTPAATVGARLYTDIRDRGEDSPFVQTAPGTFSLKDKQPKGNKEIDSRQGGDTPEASATAKNSFTSCAEMVLERFADQKPMHYREITKRAIEQGWLTTKGKTPEATMYAVILTEIKRQQERGEQPRFRQMGNGLVALNKWTRRGLTASIDLHNERVRQELHNRLLAMPPGKFEKLVSILLARMGFDSIEVTKTSGDGGIDVRGVLTVDGSVRIKMAVQAKRWKPAKHVQAPTVQQVRGSLGAHEQGLIITTSDFSAGARQEAIQPNKTPIGLINGEQLVGLLMEHGIGVKRTAQYLFEIEDEHFPSREQSDS